MRIPSNRMQSTMMTALNRALGRIERIQMEMASGKRILKPSDDPPGTIQVLSLRRQLDEITQFKRNISNGLRWNTETETSLTAMIDILVQMKEYATRGASESSDGREAMGRAVGELLESLVDQGRSQIDRRYLFSGFNNSTAPYESCQDVVGETFVAAAAGVAMDLGHAQIVDGSVVITDGTGATVFVEGTDYSVDYTTGRVTVLGGGAISEGMTILASYTTEGTSSVQLAQDIEGSLIRQIGKDQTMAVNLLAPEIFQSDVDVFGVAIQLKDALWRDDPDAVSNLLDSIGQSIEQVTDLLGLVGTRAERLEGATLRFEGDEIALQSFISEIEGVDLTSAVVRLQAEQFAYQSALAATSRIMQINMFDYL